MVSMNEATNSSAGVTRRRACRSLVLGWTDPESGERLLVDVQGPAGFLQGLGEHGFEVLADTDSGVPEGWGRREAVVAVARPAPRGASCGGPANSRPAERPAHRKGA